MSDEDALSLLNFVLDRFAGNVPPQKMLINAIEDWRNKSGLAFIDPDEPIKPLLVSKVLVA